MKVGTSIALLAAMLISGCSKQGTEASQRHNEPKPVFLGRIEPSEFNVPVGTTITVELPAFSGAPYFWKLDFTPKLFQETDPIANPANAGKVPSQMPGAVYDYRIGFKAIKKGTETIRMRCSQLGRKSRSDEIWETTVTITD